MNQIRQLNSKNIILASASPRREMLLKQLGFQFRIVIKEIEEICPDIVNPDEVAACLARMKADEFIASELGPDDIVITADTVVSLKNQLIGKPGNRKEATEMLKRLSGEMHEVYTGVCLKAVHKEVLFTDITRVWFAALSEPEIDHYLDVFKPFDKAGAYGIQEWIGYVGVTRIEGSFYNVMGLPTHRLYEELMRF